METGQGSSWARLCALPAPECVDYRVDGGDGCWPLCSMRTQARRETSPPTAQGVLASRSPTGPTLL